MISYSEPVAFFYRYIFSEREYALLIHKEYYLISYSYLCVKGKLTEHVLGFIG